MDAKDFYEKEKVRLQNEISQTNPNTDQYPVLLERMDKLDEHKELALERKDKQYRRRQSGFKKWINQVNPNTIIEVVGSGITYLGGIKLIVALEKNGGAFISGAKNLLSKVKLRI